jgi:hypothetical protein
MNSITDRTIHVRVQGRSHDLSLEDLGIVAGMSDNEIREAVSRHLDITLDSFKNTIVERHATGSLTIRPEAVFG